MKALRFLLRRVPAPVAMFTGAVGGLLLFVFVGLPLVALLVAAGLGGAAAFFWMLWSLLGALGGEPGAWRQFVVAILCCAGAITVSATVFHYGFEFLRRSGSKAQRRPALSLTLRDASFNS